MLQIAIYTCKIKLRAERCIEAAGVGLVLCVVSGSVKEVLFCGCAGRNVCGRVSLFNYLFICLFYRVQSNI